MATTISMYELCKVVNQIATDAKDNKYPKDYKNEEKIGLRREELGERIQDRRVIDGFAVKFAGDVIRLSYSSSQNIREIGDDFEEQINVTIEKIMNYIKKQFNQLSGSTLKVKRLMDRPYIFVGVQGITEEDVRYSGYVDYKIKNALSDEPADYEAKFKNEKNKVNLKEGLDKLEKSINKKYVL